MILAGLSSLGEGGESRRSTASYINNAKVCNSDCSAKEGLRTLCPGSVFLPEVR